MSITREQINTICNIVDVNSDSFKLEYRDNCGPEILLKERIIHINNTNDWREIYQFAHEVLHLSFWDHTGEGNVWEVNWIEEIVCESFSIYCLCSFADAERINWCGYLFPNFYKIKNRNLVPIKIGSLDQLNQELDGHKSFEILDFIQPYVLCISDLMLCDIENLYNCLNYMVFVENNKIVIDKNVKITKVLHELQYLIEHS